MEKITNYIKSGKGNGLLFLLATALIITIFWMFLFKQIYNGIKPQLLLAADDILPITVENSQITSPLDTYKKIDIMFGSKEETNKIFPIVLDTREEPESFAAFPMGLFINKNTVNIKFPSEIKVLTWQNGTWDKNLAEEFLNYFSTTFSLIISILMVFALSIFLLIKTFLSAYLGKYIVAPLVKDTNPNFSVFMRLSAILVSITELIILAISFFTGLRIGMFPQIFIVLILFYGFFTRQKNTAE